MKANRIIALAIAVAAIFTTTAADTDYRELAADVNLIVANDLGRNGAHLQCPIAALMGTVADQTGPEAVLALGDTHHYLGVQSVADPLWMTNYELIYDHPELQVEWCPVLGNHEYRGDTDAVTGYSDISRRWSMPARYYSRIFDNDGTHVKVVFIDTAPLIDKYRADSAGYPDAGRQDMEAQLAWLDRELSDREGAEWLVVAGHHPVFADTDKSRGERADMQARVAPLLRRHKVDMYICGHIHNFQHIREDASDIDYVVNSSGSLSRRNVAPVQGSGPTGGEPLKSTERTVFCNGDEGFSLLAAGHDTLRLHLIDHTGKVIHTVTRHKKSR